MESLTIEPDPDSRTSIDFDSTVFIEAPSPVEEEKEIVIDNRKTVKFNLFDSESLQEKWKGKLNGDAKIIVSVVSLGKKVGVVIALVSGGGNCKRTKFGTGDQFGRDC